MAILRRKTARLFLVASHFLEVTRAFGEAGEDIEERSKYAKWKASDIVKAFNEGRQPVPGPPNTQAEGPPEQPPAYPPAAPAADRRTSDTGRNLPSMGGSYHPSPPADREPALPPPVTFSPPPPAAPPQEPPPAPYSPPFPAAAYKPASSPAPPQQPYAAPPQQPYTPPQQQYTPPVSAAASYDQAEKHCRYATSAIQFEDVPTAIKELEAAIAVLRATQLR